MASEPKKKKLVRRVSYAPIQKLIAAVSLLSFVVIVVAGFQAQVRFTTMATRAFVVMMVIGVAGRIIVRILSTYEEMNGDQA